MSLIVGFLKKNNYIHEVKNVYEEKFKILGKNIEDTLNKINTVSVDDFGVFFEYPYVEKQYRDTYYNYLSTKHQEYNRNTIRLSFFKGEICRDDFRKKDLINELNDKFLGYITLRPSADRIIGRSVLSPHFLKANNFVCSQAKFNVLINGVKLDIVGFPFCSQDGEVLSCAETTILNLLEYFGTKYPEYKPVLPSVIIRKLSQRAFERQIPTAGLNTEDISFVLKELGFGTKVYYRKSYKKSFRKFFNSYVDSGIPFIAALENENIGHAILVIGREAEYRRNFKEVVAGLLDGPLDFSEGITKYVVMDDNTFPYRLVPFESPTFDYDDKDFENCNIESIVVPLYSKIYVDVELASERIKLILKEKRFFKSNKVSFTRTFLASSRSFKGEICSNELLDSDVKEFVINKHMPKFIWICELFNSKGAIDNGRPSGIIVVDATEPNVEKNHILLIAYDNYYLTWDSIEQTYKESIVDLTNLYTFEHNLKGTN